MDNGTWDWRPSPVLRICEYKTSCRQISFAYSLDGYVDDYGCIHYWRQQLSGPSRHLGPAYLFAVYFS
ncbi:MULTISPECIES: hypothetical protein [unclassified Paenibacillus]|uniref:hypothetical protein n=1 Tax=unclassified Paenibacillus TaxID=185978 RepID=UPI001AE86025|nr:MULTISPECIES: hypothetical protein [unclassified Paenibacillus]MBP1154701.1 hypothetical protein [Paenibacillus sp. PvP091]MBP1169915.1 hypothetical protein [Paenibacillus sp. PvR098]MBP2440943.1 hypothetical protein [Paenibacillus sp. PvP052]